MATGPELHDAAGLTSLARGAVIFEVSRDTLRRKIAENGITSPSADKAGNPLYKILDLARSVQGMPAKQQPGPKSPDDMSATERNAYYQAEQRRIALELQAGKLMQSSVFEERIATNAKTFAQFLDTLPDRMERAAHMSPDQIEAFNDCLNAERERLYGEMVASLEAVRAIEQKNETLTTGDSHS